MCLQDCPVAASNPFGSEESDCSGQGNFAAATGDCICYKAYAGENCEECQTGYTKLGNGLCTISFSEEALKSAEKLEVEKRKIAKTAEIDTEENRTDSKAKIWAPTVGASCALAGILTMCCGTILIRRRKRSKVRKPRLWLHPLET